VHSRFDQFRKTELGGQLAALIDSRDRYIEFAALSRAGVAAIAAIVARHTTSGINIRELAF
jgi:hypothetical protein